MHMHLHMHCKHKAVTSFWVATGYVQSWQRAHDITGIAAHALIGFHVYRYDGTFIHYLPSYSKLSHFYKDGWGEVIYWEP